ncbi:MAG: protease pro-enzyme activation domain-containing protein [Silvibacterium sp.]
MASRITAPVSDTKLVTLPGNVHPLAVAGNDRGVAPASTSTGKVQLILKRSRAQQMALTQYLADVQNPHSASYHKWLTPSEYGTKFGISDADLATVEQWLAAEGLKVESVSPARNLIEFSGDFGQVESAFHTPMHVFEVGGRSHFANTLNPQIPAALGNVISGVGPLHDFRPVSQAKFSSKAHFDTSSKAIQPDLTLFDSSGNPYLYVDPADAATIYDTPNATLNPAYTGTTYDGTGVNIGVAGDSNITIGDVTNYRVAFLNETSSSANVPQVVVDGNDPGINGDEGEALLDVEVAGGIAPKAKVYFYTSSDTELESGLIDSIYRAVSDNTVSILNISFGACEAEFGTSGNQLISEMMQQAAAQGISVTVSAGDSGSAGCDSDASTEAENGLAVNGLASTPYNIAVGGTDFDVLLNGFTTYVQDESGGNPTSGVSPYYRTALSYIPEEPWNDSTYPNENTASNVALDNGGTNIIAGSGGESSCVNSVTNADGSVTCQSGYAKPAFQGSLTPTDGVRDIPDVSFLAANGLYGAVWVICADPQATGSEGTGADCQTTDGQFTSSSTFTGVGGTSAAAPAFAGMLALIEQKTGSRLGQANYVLYQLAQSNYSTIFHDITEGDNSVVCASGSPNCGDNGFLTGYDAGTGYDLASGLGSVDATQLVNNWASATLASTSTAFTINGSMSSLTVTHGTSLTFKANVSPTTATGAVAIVDTANENTNGVLNNGQIAIPLTGGVGSISYNGLPGGTYTVYGQYSGDTSDAASTSDPGIQVTVNAEDSTTNLSTTFYSADNTTTPLTSLSNVPYGSYLLADATIQGKAEGASTQGIATGTVTLTDNGTAVGAALGINQTNEAFFESPSTAYTGVFAPGTHKLVANYSGDASYNASSSTPVNFTVVKGVTSVAVVPASTSLSSTQSDKITIQVNTSSVGAYPTGTLTIAVNGTTVETTSSLQQSYGDTGVAAAITLTLQGSSLASGTNTITATYGGDNNYAGSTGTATLTVAEAAFQLTTTGSINVQAGATTGDTSTITVAPSNGFTGVVNLSCAVSSEPASASNPATCSIPSTVNITGTTPMTAALTAVTESTTTAGSYAITVTATDASTGKITKTATVNLTVTSPVSTQQGITLANSGGITIAPGATTGNTSTISVTPAGGFTGAVNLSCAVTTSLTSPTDAPTCSVPTSVTVSGSSAASATLTVTTTPATSGAVRAIRFGIPGTALATLLFLGLPRRRRWAGYLGALVLLIGTVAITGCGAGSSSTSSTGSGSSSGSGSSGGSTGTTAGAYTVTVTGTDAATGKITGSTAVTLTVN